MKQKKILCDWRSEYLEKKQYGYQPHLLNALECWCQKEK
jgi:hypothetical protein